MQYTATANPANPKEWIVFVAADARATPTRTGYTIEKLRAGFLVKNAGNVIANGYVFASVAHALGWLNAA